MQGKDDCFDVICEDCFLKISLALDGSTLGQS